MVINLWISLEYINLQGKLDQSRKWLTRLGLSFLLKFGVSAKNIIAVGRKHSNAAFPWKYDIYHGEGLDIHILLDAYG